MCSGVKKWAAALAAAGALFALASCATAEEGERGLSLFGAIEQSAKRLAGDLPAGTVVAVVAFDSGESDGLSYFIMDELAGALLDMGTRVMTRGEIELALVRGEQDFGMTGEVSDETAQSIGHFLGVEFVIAGRLWDIGFARRFSVNAIRVETAEHVSFPRFDVRNDESLQNIIAGVGRRPAPVARQRPPALEPGPQPAPLAPPPPAAQALQPAPPPFPAAAPMAFARVEGGAFLMGSPAGEPGRYGDEGPQRRVTVSGFYMSVFPVTQREWREVMGTSPSHFRGDNLPVESVSWFEAVEFANRLSRRAGLTPAYVIDGAVVAWAREANGYRLPTEAEWEFAARGGIICGGRYLFSGSDIADEVAWTFLNSGRRTHDVGSLRPNALGLHDMSGNVWEWVWDLHGPYPHAAQSNPAGSSAGYGRVFRGGSWSNSAENARAARRNWVLPTNRLNSIGFRVVRPLD